MSAFYPSQSLFIKCWQDFFIYSTASLITFPNLWVIDTGDMRLTLSALRLASLACCSQASARSIALSFSSFIACIFFLMASIAENCVCWSGGAKRLKIGVGSDRSGNWELSQVSSAAKRVGELFKIAEKF